MTMLTNYFMLFLVLIGLLLFCVAYYSFVKKDFRILGSLIGCFGLLFVAAGGDLGIPIVLNNTQLGWLSTYQTLPVWRLGFASPGDYGQPILYTGSNSACSLNSGNGDGGSQVKSDSGGCWLASFPTGRVAAEVWGCAADGTTDAAACLNAAATGLAATGGGELWLSKRYRVASDFTIPAKVTVVGPWPRPGLVAGANYTIAPGTIIGQVRVLSGGGLKNIIIARNGLLNPGAPGTTVAQNLQTAYAQRAAFSGTGVTLGSGVDGSGTTTIVRDILILGFNRCLDAVSVGIPVLEGVYGDCENGMRVRQVGELGTIAHNHFWEFLNFGGPDAAYENGLNGSTTYFYSAPITGIDNNGSGLIRLTFAGGHSYETGNTIIVKGAPSNTNANNTLANPMWTVTKISGTVLDLQGSTFANTGATGTAYTTVLYREGEAYTLGANAGLGCDHCSMIDNASFAYKTGVHVTDSAHVRIVAGRSDTWVEPLRLDTTGLLVDGTTDVLQVDGMSIAAAGTLINYNASGGGIDHSSFSNIGLWGCVGNAIVINSGSLVISGGVISQTPSTSFGGDCQTVATGGQLYLTGGLQNQNNNIIQSGGTITVGDVVDTGLVLLSSSAQAERYSFYVSSTFVASQSGLYVFPRPAMSYLNMTSSYCVAGVPATGTAVFDLRKNGVSYGSATFAPGASSATFSTAAGPFNRGDYFAWIAPASPDASLSVVACTFAFGPR
jgi:hypothetical protein